MAGVKEFKYGVVIDAGSSGSRAYVYRWEAGKLESIGLAPGYTSKNEEPGIATLAPLIAPAKAVDLNAPVHLSDQITKNLAPAIAKETRGKVTEHLDKLVKHASRFVPPLEIKRTPLFMLATGGMRRIQMNQYESYDILRSAITAYLSKTGFEKPKFETISGEDEGMYGWVAVNFVDKCFTPGHTPRGFMELGGESAQFAVSIKREDNKKYEGPLYRLEMPDEIYYLYVKTWMGIGSNTAWERHLKKLRESDCIMPMDPCVPKGYSYRLLGSDKIVMGTGDFGGCMKEALSLLDCTDHRCLNGELCIYGGKVEATAENPEKPGSVGCLLRDEKSGYPLLEFDKNQFRGASVYWHAMHSTFRKRSDRNWDDFKSLWDDVIYYSGKNWEELKAETPRARATNYRFLWRGFFTAAMVMSTLFLGFGIPMPPEAIKVTRMFAKERVKYAKIEAEDAEEDARKKSDAATWALGPKMEVAEMAEEDVDEARAEVQADRAVEGAAGVQEAAEKKAKEEAKAKEAKRREAEAEAGGNARDAGGAAVEARRASDEAIKQTQEIKRLKKAEADKIAKTAKKRAAWAEKESAEAAGEKRKAEEEAREARENARKATEATEKADDKDKDSAVDLEGSAYGAWVEKEIALGRAIPKAERMAQRAERAKRVEEAAQNRVTKAGAAEEERPPLSETHDKIYTQMLSLHTVPNEGKKKRLYDAVQATKSSGDYIDHEDHLDHCKLKAKEARTERNEAADKAIEAYDKFLAARKKKDDLKSLGDKIGVDSDPDTQLDVDKQLEEAYDNCRKEGPKYRSVDDTEWPLGKIVLYVAKCTPVFLTKDGWDAEYFD